MRRSQAAPAPAVLEFLNVPLDRENWAERCVQFLGGEGALSRPPKRGEEEAALARFSCRGSRLTLGNLAFLQERLAEIFAEVAARGRPSPRHTELINAALAQTRGLRFRLERPLAGPADPAGPLLLFRPQTFDLGLLAYFAAARLLATLHPARIRRCPHCGRFFVQRTARPKRFCRESCRSQYHNRIRTETGRQALYMRRHRARLRARRAGKTR